MSSWFSSLLDGEHSGRKGSRRHGFHGSPSSQSKNHANFSNEPPVTEFYDAFPAIHHLSAPSPHPRQSAASPHAPPKKSKKQTRVLQERRILSVSRTSPPTFPMRCSFRTHPFSRMRFPGLAPWAGMHCPVGANCTMAFRSHVHAPNGHRVPTCQRGSVGATRTPCFESHAPLGQTER